ncbi:hypothetical protein [uncultured Psychrosphaera sp.]|uniref:hypothetical protein n=1 Tax=uncultured Psychrosphaera sp. TaxID=1403522 RepID=UPI0030FB4789
MRVLSLLIFLFTFKSTAATKQIELQTSGLIGVGHAFYSLTFSDRHTISMGIGYVPKQYDHDDMRLFSVKYRYTPDIKYTFQIKSKLIQWKPFSFSTTMLFGKDHDDYKILPDRDIPEGYYTPTDRRFIFSMQSNFLVRDNIELYWDWSVLDIGVVNYTRNFEFYRDNYYLMGLTGIVSSGVGIRVYL